MSTHHLDISAGSASLGFTQVWSLACLSSKLIERQVRVTSEKDKHQFSQGQLEHLSHNVSNTRIVGQRFNQRCSSRLEVYSSRSRGFHLAKEGILVSALK